MLYREPMWLKSCRVLELYVRPLVSVLYREPMWLKSNFMPTYAPASRLFQCSTVSRCG